MERLTVRNMDFDENRAGILTDLSLEKRRYCEGFIIKDFI